MSLRTRLDYFSFCLFFSRIESKVVVVVVAVAGGEKAFLLRSFDMKKIQKETITSCVSVKIVQNFFMLTIFFVAFDIKFAGIFMCSEYIKNFRLKYNKFWLIFIFPVYNFNII